MKLPQRLGYKIYFFTYTALSVLSILGTFLPESVQSDYYTSLGAFPTLGGAMWLLAMLCSLLTILSFYPVFCYAFKKEWPGRTFFKPLLLARLIADATGHNFELQHLKSYAHAEPALAAVMGVIIFASIAPSYWAHYRYCFPTRIS